MRSKSSKSADLLPRWEVYSIRKKAETVATVRAKDEAAALNLVAEQYGIDDPHKRNRLVARRVS